MNDKKHIMVFAAEKSGENHSYYLIEELKKISSDIKISIVGSGKMLATGITPLFSITALNSFQVSFFKRIIHRLKLKKYVDMVASYIKENKVDVFVFTGIADDTQYFVKALLRLALKHDIKTAYYFSPHVWIWSRRKTKRIAKEVDVIFTFFPKEEMEYRKYGANTYSCAHPIIDELPKACSKDDFALEYEIPSSKKLVAYLPGSRKGELKRHLRLFVKMLEENKDNKIHFVCALEESSAQKKFLKKTSGFKNVSFLKKGSDYYKLISSSDLCITCSGTATLEVALYQRPQIVFYKLSCFDYFLWRTLAFVSGLKDLSIAMPNIIAGKKNVPEFIHKDANAESILKEASFLLTHPHIQKAFLDELKTFVGKGGGIKKAASYLLFLLR